MADVGSLTWQMPVNVLEFSTHYNAWNHFDNNDSCSERAIDDLLTSITILKENADRLFHDNQ